LDSNQDGLASCTSFIFGIEPILPALFVTKIPTWTPLKNLENTLPHLFRPSKVFLDFFPVSVRRGLVLAPSTAAVVASRQGFEVKVFQRSWFIFLEVTQNYLSGDFRLENI
jgi:hypothetical protein